MADSLSKKIVPSSIRITCSISQILEKATIIGAKRLTGWDDDDIDALDYMDEDDPRLLQWETAKNIARLKLFDYMLRENFKKTTNTNNSQASNASEFSSLKETVESLKELVLALVDYNNRRG